MGLGGTVFLLGFSMLKVFAWMQMERNAVMREIKGLELHVFSLSGRISELDFYKQFIFTSFALPRDDFSPTLNFRYFSKG